VVFLRKTPALLNCSWAARPIHGLIALHIPDRARLVPNVAKITGAVIVQLNVSRLPVTVP